MLQSSYQINKVLSRSSEADNIYLNLACRNIGTSTTDIPFIPASFSQQFSNSLLKNGSSKYRMSVVRFSLPANLLPITIMPIQSFPNTDVNKTIFSVSLSFGAFSAQTFLQWQPDTYWQVPPAPNVVHKTQFVNDGYYYLTSFQRFLDMVNIAFASCFATLGGLAVLPVGAEAPYMILNPNDTFSIIAQVANYDETLATPINIYMNLALSQCFGSFATNFIGYNTVNGKDTQYLVYDQGDNLYIPPNTLPVPATADYYEMNQEYASLADISAQGVQRIVFTTSMPIRSEQIPIPVPYGTSSNDNTSNNEQSNYQLVLTDFIPSTGGSGIDNLSGNIVYLPTAQYRYVDLITDDPINEIDLRIWWCDSADNLYPVLLPLNSACSVKILFEHK